MKLASVLVFAHLFVPAHGSLWDANFTGLCEEVRSNLIARNVTLVNDTTIVCGKTYSPDTLPAQPLRIPLKKCISLNPGWEISKVEKYSQWAGPLIGFLLPSLGFIIAIPRQWNLRVKSKRFDSGPLSLGWMFWGLLRLTIDTLLGIAIVFGWAGPFIAGAIHEAWVDRAILNKVRQIASGLGRKRVSDSEWFALAITMVGTFQARAEDGQGVTFAQKVMDEILAVGPRKSRLFIARLCHQQLPFATQVGVPLIFYIGAFVYSLVDAQQRLGDNDTAHSIAFGLWYFTIVLVAIVSCVMLGVGSPQVIEGLLADHDLTNEGYKLKWLSERRLELERWSALTLQTSSGLILPTNPVYRDIFDLHYANRAAFTGWLTLAVPCSLAIAVSYHTPEIGFSCRSTTVLSYICAETFLILLWLPHSSPSVRKAQAKARKDKNWLKWLGIRLISATYYVTGILAFLITIAGTIMQLLGVYRNCICKAGLYWGLPTTRDRSPARVLVSTDTAESRDAAAIWMGCGIAGVVWIATLCFVGAWHRLRMRQRCLNLIDDIGNR